MFAFAAAAPTFHPLRVRNRAGAIALSGAMDIAAITELRSRVVEAIASAEKYRELAERKAALRDFYHALATTYERSAREMTIWLDKAEQHSGLAMSDAA
jgi:3-deoxy-D-arabino-heptulosonate 7-phosphate (DAHP) synthase class II